MILLLFTVANELVPYKRRCSVIPLGNHYDHRDRTSYFCVHGSSSCTACCRIFFDDIYNDSNGLTDVLEKLLHPLNRIHVPVHEISMMMSIALRFIDSGGRGADKIMKA